MTVAHSLKTSDTRIVDLEFANRWRLDEIHVLQRRCEYLEKQLDALYKFLKLEYKTIPSTTVVVETQ